MNPTTISIILVLSSLIVGYFFGAIPTSVIIGKVFFHKDPRDYFSHNPGGTNAGRVFGKKIGVLVIFLDMLKTIIPVFALYYIITLNPQIQEALQWTPTYNASKLVYWSAALFSALGHCFPVYLGFKGGKAVACFMGMNVITSWLEFMVAGFTFLGIKAKSHITSISSISGAIAGAIAAWMIYAVQVSTGWNMAILTWSFGLFPWPEFGWEFAVVDTVIAGLLIIRHYENIQRILKGTEHKS